MLIPCVESQAQFFAIPGVILSYTNRIDLFGFNYCGNAKAPIRPSLGPRCWEDRALASGKGSENPMYCLSCFLTENANINNFHNTVRHIIAVMNYSKCTNQCWIRACCPHTKIKLMRYSSLSLTWPYL